MIKRKKLKGCCGSHVYIFETEKPLNKNWVQIFKDEKYSVPKMYIDANMLFVEKKGIIAHGTFGSKRMQIKVNSKDNNKLLDNLEILLNKAQNS